MPSLVVRSPHVKVGGTDLSATLYDHLTVVTVEHELNLTGRAEIEFIDPDATLVTSTQFTIGAPVEIGFNDEEGSVSRVFTGEIVAIEIERDAADVPVARYTAMDKTHRLGRAAAAKSFLNVTYADVVTALIGAAGLRSSISATSGTVPYYLQHGTPLETIDDCCRRSGYEWWVDADGTFHFDKPGSNGDFAAELGENLRTLSARMAPFRPTEVVVQGWDAKKKQLIAGSATASSASSVVASALTSHKPDAFGTFTHLEIDDESARDSAEAKTIAEHIVHLQAADSIVATATVLDAVGVALRSNLQVSEAGGMDGTHIVTSIRHRYDYDDGLVTTLGTGRRHRAGIADLVATDRVGDLQDFVVGIVTNVADPDGLSRVKVKFPVLDAKIESDWARVAMVGAGSTRGFSFLPAVDDEVLVAFERGDHRYPVILGGLVNQTNKGPVPVLVSGKIVNQRVVTETGHELLFHEESGKEAVKLTVAKDKKHLFFENGKGVDLETDEKLVIKVGTNTVTIDPSAGVTIESAKDITLKAATGKVVVDALEIELKAQTNLKATAGASLEAKGATSKLEGSAMTEIKGGMVKIN